MSKLKLLGIDSKKDIIKTLTYADTYEFKDSVTDQPITVATLIDKDILTPMNGRIKEDGLGTWDSIVIELGHDPDYVAAALPIVLKSFNSPDFKWYKDQGKGREPQLHHVRGERPTMYEFHSDKHGNHLHLKSFRWSFDRTIGKTALCPLDVAKVEDQQFAYTNRMLAEAGLSPIGVFDKGFSNGNRPTEETKREVHEAIQTQEPIEKKIQEIQQSTYFDEKTIDKSLEVDKKQFEDLLQKIKIKQEEMNNKIAAKQAFAESVLLKHNVKVLTESLEEARTNLGEAIDQNDQLILDKAKIQDELNTTKTDLDTANALIAEQSTDIQALEADKATLTADKATLTADKTALTADKVQLQADKVTLEADKVKLQADVDAYKLGTAKLKEIILNLEADGLKKDGLIETLSEANKDLRSDLNRERTAKEAAETVAKDAQATAATQTALATDLQRQNATLAADSAKATADLDKMRQERDEANKAKAEQAALIAQLQADAVRLVKQSAESAHALEVERKQRIDLVESFNRQKVEINEIRSVLEFISEKYAKATDALKKFVGSITATAEKKTVQQIIKTGDTVKPLPNETLEARLARLKKISGIDKPAPSGKKDDLEDDGVTPKRPKL